MEERQGIFQCAYEARSSIILLDEPAINQLLESIALETGRRVHHILSENEKDLQRMEENSIHYDGLVLTEEHIKNIISHIREIIRQPSPVGKILHQTTHLNGMQIKKQLTPLGIIGFVCDAKPAIIFDIISFCLKTGNVCILKGISDAKFTTEAIVDIVRYVLDSHNIDPNICCLLPHGKDMLQSLMEAKEYVDVIIPRGTNEFINYIIENSDIPVISSITGVCHTYFHSSGSKELGKRILTNAKTRKIQACNSLDCLIIDKERLDDLPYLCDNLQHHNVIIYADKQAFHALEETYPAELLKEAGDNIYSTEFRDYKVAVKTVSGIDKAISHIASYGGKHSESIISEDKEATVQFKKAVDAVCVYVNTSTAFTDGGQFGLGGEVAVSTQKIHCRGPVAMEELCTYKWIIEGEGQIRE